MGGSVPSEDGFMNGVICVLRDCPTQSKVRTLEGILLRIFFCWCGIFTKYVGTHLCCGSHAIQVLISSTTGIVSSRSGTSTLRLRCVCRTEKKS